MQLSRRPRRPRRPSEEEEVLKAQEVCEVSASMGKKLDIAAFAVPANMARQETCAGFAMVALMDGFGKIASSVCHVPMAD